MPPAQVGKQGRGHSCCVEVSLHAGVTLLLDRGSSRPTGRCPVQRAVRWTLPPHRATAAGPAACPSWDQDAASVAPGAEVSESTAMSCHWPSSPRLVTTRSHPLGVSSDRLRARAVLPRSGSFHAGTTRLQWTRPLRPSTSTIALSPTLASWRPGKGVWVSSPVPSLDRGQYSTIQHPAGAPIPTEFGNPNW